MPTAHQASKQYQALDPQISSDQNNLQDNELLENLHTLPELNASSLINNRFTILARALHPPLHLLKLYNIDKNSLFDQCPNKLAQFMCTNIFLSQDSAPLNFLYVHDEFILQITPIWINDKQKNNNDIIEFNLYGGSALPFNFYEQLAQKGYFTVKAHTFFQNNDQTETRFKIIDIEDFILNTHFLKKNSTCHKILWPDGWTKDRIVYAIINAFKNPQTIKKLPTPSEGGSLFELVGTESIDGLSIYMLLGIYGSRTIQIKQANPYFNKNVVTDEMALLLDKSAEDADDSAEETTQSIYQPNEPNANQIPTPSPWLQAARQGKTTQVDSQSSQNATQRVLAPANQSNNELVKLFQHLINPNIQTAPTDRQKVNKTLLNMQQPYLKPIQKALEALENSYTNTSITIKCPHLTSAMSVVLQNIKHIFITRLNIVKPTQKNSAYTLSGGHTNLDFYKELAKEHYCEIKELEQDDNLVSSIVLNINGTSIKKTLWPPHYKPQQIINSILQAYTNGITNQVLDILNQKTLASVDAQDNAGILIHLALEKKSWNNTIIIQMAYPQLLFKQTEPTAAKALTPQQQ